MRLNIFPMKNKSGLTKIIIIALFLLGIFIKLYYINYTETWERQHDVISFGADEGHAAYIEYILNNKSLPDFDPREKWGFFQPPLHHIISAFVMDVSMKAGLDIKRCQENTQIPTLIYMILLSVMSLYIFAKLRGLHKDKIFSDGCLVMLAIVALHPMFIIMSGSINNDALQLVMSLFALIVAAKWYEKPDILRTVFLAVIIGLSMLAKLTGGLVAVPIAIIMAIKVFGFDGGIRTDKHTKVRLSDRLRFFFRKYFGKMLIFAAIVFPLGLSFSIRNKLKWDVPFNYIPPVGENFPESVTMKNRLLDIGTDSVYTKMIARGDAFDEYNVFLALIKTSLFGEYSFSDVSRWMNPLTIILFVSAVLVIVFALFATFKVAFSKKIKLALVWKVLLLFTYVTYLAAYFYFALSSSNFSAQDFRYAGICIVCEGIFAGVYVDSIKDKRALMIIKVVAITFAASSFLTYALLGFKAGLN